MTHKKHFLFIGLFLLICVPFLLGAAFASNEADTDTLRREALELRNKARRADCEKMGTRILACYKGDDGACLRMHDSIAWFTNEYGEAPELSCPQEDLPFGEGAGEHSTR